MDSLWILTFFDHDLPSIFPMNSQKLSSEKCKRNVQKFKTKLLPSKKQAPSDYAPGKTTSRINHIIKGFKVKKEFSKLTPVQKAKATKVLKHNHYDVTILSVLLEEIINKDPSCLKKAIYKLTDIKI